MAISLLLILILLFRSGNVSPSPVPDSVNSSFNSDLSSVSSATEELISNHLSEMRLNIQNIVPKIVLIKGESEEHDVLVFTESWLKETIANESIQISNQTAADPLISKSVLLRATNVLCTYITTPHLDNQPCLS